MTTHPTERATAQDRARYKAAAVAAIHTARTTGQSVYELMEQATGLPCERCHGYITTAPNFSTDIFEIGQARAARVEHSGPIVRVRRQWNDWREAAYRFEDIAGLHWDTESGGINATAPQPFLHGYVMCDGMVSGELAHSCMHGKGPHRIKVCIVKKANEPEVFKRLLNEAGPKPKRA